MFSKLFSKKYKKYVWVIILVLAIIVGINAHIAFYNSGFFGFTFRDAANNKKVFANEIYSLEYPKSYRAAPIELTNLHLNNNDKWGDEESEYTFVKGMFIVVDYNEDTDISDYIDQMMWEGKKIKEKKINGKNVTEVTAGHNHPLGVPSHTAIVLTNNKGVLDITLVVGKRITKEEYEHYLKEFNEIVKSVKFSNDINNLEPFSFETFEHHN